MVRFVAVDAVVVHRKDSLGRGAWLCRSTDCVELALGNGGFGRALRMRCDTSRVAAEMAGLIATEFGAQREKDATGAEKARE